QHHYEHLLQPDTRSLERDFGFPRYSSHSDSKIREHHKPVLRQVLSLKPSILFQSRIEKVLSGYGENRNESQTRSHPATSELPLPSSEQADHSVVEFLV